MTEQRAGPGGEPHPRRQRRAIDIRHPKTGQTAETDLPVFSGRLQDWE